MGGKRTSGPIGVAHGRGFRTLPCRHLRPVLALRIPRLGRAGRPNRDGRAVACPRRYRAVTEPHAGARLEVSAGDCCPATAPCRTDARGHGGHARLNPSRLRTWLLSRRHRCGRRRRRGLVPAAPQPCGEDHQKNDSCSCPVRHGYPASCLEKREPVKKGCTPLLAFTDTTGESFSDRGSP